MGFSAQKYRKEQHERPWKINPVWRGIGCFLILLIPIMAWFGAQVLMQAKTPIPLPWDMSRSVTLPYVHVTVIDRVTTEINGYLVTHNVVTGQLFFTVILIFVGFGLLSVIYAIFYRIIGPPRYGPFDIPPGAMRR